MMLQNIYEEVRRRVPIVSIDRDEWVRRMMRWHFSEATGSLFWLQRRSSLPFHPIQDIEGFNDLPRFGLFDKACLRRTRTADLIPRGFHDRPRRLFETAGTT